MNEKRVRFGLYGLILVIAIVFSFIYDYEILLFFESLSRVFLTKFFYVFGSISNEIVVFFFLTSLFLWREHKRKWILPLWLSMFFSGIVSLILKLGVARPRPFLTHQTITVLAVALKQAYLTWDTSFPSFHTVLVFSALPILDKEFPKFKYIWFGFAVIIAISRVYFGVHYFSDVLIGSLIGYGIGFLMIKSEEKYKFGEKVIKRLGFKK